MANLDSIQFKRMATLYSMGFLLVFGYSFARPCIDSIFLEHYSTSDLPNAWLIISIASAFVIALYNRVNQRYAILPLFGGTSLICAAMLAALLVGYFAGFTSTAYILYIWKELYMVVLMETFWSFADIVFSVSTARSSYGYAMAISSFGGILGNLAVGPTAKSIGTRYALWFLVVFLFLGFVIAYLGRKVSDAKPQKSKEMPNLGLGIKTLFSSKYLIPLAILACTVQVVAGLIDFKFNGMLAENYIDTDARTNVLGQIHAAVNVFGISIQLLMSPILKFFGVGNVFKSIPFLLSTVMLAFIFVPSFAIVIALKISNKALDYSLFRGTKEILYIPLSREEKTQGKGIIDIFMYRLARGLSSLILTALISLGLTGYLMEFSLGLVLIWLALAIIIAKRYRSIVQREDEP